MLTKTLFSEINNLSSDTVQRLSQTGFTYATAVQKAVLDQIQTRDVLVEAVTGSGKTLAFVIPIVEYAERFRPISKDTLATESSSSESESNDDIPPVIEPTKQASLHSIIISPTKELAQQTASLLLHLSCECTLVTDALDPAILQVSSNWVGTPGHLSTLLKKAHSQKRVVLDDFRYLILDEADRLLDQSFQESIQSILHILPKMKRTACFSATMSDALEHVAKLGLRQPLRIVVKQERGDRIIREERIPRGLRNEYIITEVLDKASQLANILHSTNCQKTIVYFSTCAQVDYFYRQYQNLLKNTPIALQSLHGHIPQMARQKAMASFSLPASSSERRILFCTDVASRGLDIEDVDLVVQFDPPQDPKTFAHRIGRTARAGKEGRAIVLLTEKELPYVDFLELRGVPLHQTTVQGPHNYAQLRQTFQSLNKTDRDLYDRSIKALTSAVKSYSKHEARFIFKMDPDWIIDSARSWGLLKLPKMPELKRNGEAEASTASSLDFPDLDWTSFAYLDKAREAKRQSQKPVKDAPRFEQTDNDDLLPQKFKTLKHVKTGRKREEAWSKSKASTQAKQQKRLGKPTENPTAELQALRDRRDQGLNDAEEQERDWKEDLLERKKQRKDHAPLFADL